MKPEEKKLLEERIERASDLERMIGHYQRAFDSLSDKGNSTIGSISFVLNSTEESAIYYSSTSSIPYTADRVRFARVCWAQPDPSLNQEVRSALLTILNTRIVKLQKELDEV